MKNCDLFGLMNLFARSTGGWLGDKFSVKSGLIGRVRWLVVVMVIKGMLLMIFFRLFVQMADGATCSVVPFIKKRSLGAVAGIVGAGGNVGAVFYAQYMLRTGTALEDCFLIYGVIVSVIGLVGFSIKFSEDAEKNAVEEQLRLEAIPI